MVDSSEEEAFEKMARKWIPRIKVSKWARLAIICAFVAVVVAMMVLSVWAAISFPHDHPPIEFPTPSAVSDAAEGVLLFKFM